MAVPAFDEKELEVKFSFPDFLSGFPITTYTYPSSVADAMKGTLEKKPHWMLNGFYQSLFTPIIIPDNIARAQVFEAQKLPPEKFGGKDMFGIEWEYVPDVGGSMVRPGNPAFEDANDIIENLVWPDIDSWDWEGDSKANADFLKKENCNVMWFLTGWFERLISFMDFENAIMALFDEDQQDAIHTFFDKLSNLYIDILDRCIKYFPGIDGFCIHDDWGSQKETFFSPALAEEMIVPYMKRVTDFIHSKGKFCELHSCGHNIKQIPNYIKAGWDLWQGQEMNEIDTVFEEYGDKIVMGAFPEDFDVNDEAAARQAARNFVDTYMRPDKTAILNFNKRSCWCPAFMEEIYVYSRKKAAEMN